MKKTSFSMVALLGLSLASPVWAETPAGPAPGKPGAEKPNKPGAAPGNPGGPNGAPRPGGGPQGPKGAGPHGLGPAFGPHGTMGQKLSPEEMAKRSQTMKERMAEHAEKMASRAKELRDKAAKARASGDTKQADQLDKAAERLERGPVAPERGPGWKKAMEKRKRARLKPLYKQYGERLKNPEVQAEFKKHAMRMAKLDRMRDLARSNPDAEARQKLIERINATVAKENARHRQTLRAMMTNKDQVVSANQPGSASAAPEAAKPAAEAPQEEAPAADKEEAE